MSRTPLIEATLTGVLTDAIHAAGAWLARAVAARKGRPSEQDRFIAEWFDSYELVSGLTAPPALPTGTNEQTVAAWLQSHESQAVFQELIVVRLTDAPLSDLDCVRQNLRFTCLDAFPDLQVSDANRLSDAIFDASDFQLIELMGRLESGREAFRTQVRQAAFDGRHAALLRAIERHTNAYAEKTAADRVRERDYIARYRRVAASEHGFLEPPDFEQRRKIPIRDLYVVPDIIAGSEEDPKPARMNVWSFAERLDRSVLLGDPGGGKSTAVNVLINLMSEDSAARIPLVVILREYAREDPPAQSIIGYIEHRLETHYQRAPPTGLIESLLLAGKATVFFDGLDELVDTGRRREVSQRIENFCAQYPLTPVLVTSRRIGYGQARLDLNQFVTFQLGAFSSEQSEEYAAKWFSQERRLGEQEPAKWAAAFITESANIPDLRSNPLMLALLCILYRGEGSLPRNRPGVYERCATLLFETWDASRSINVDLRARNLIEPVLRHLAHWLLVRNEAAPVVTEEQLVSETSQYLHQRRYEDVEDAARAAREFVEFCKGRAWVFTEVGSTAEGDALFTFSHRTFLEYFAAAHLSSICDSPERLARALTPHVAHQEWDVVAQLALQIKNRNTQDGAIRFYTAILGSRRYTSPGSVGNLLSFLARCLSFIDIQPRIIRELTDRCLDHLLLDPRNNVTPLGNMMTIQTARTTVSDQLELRLRAYIETPASPLRNTTLLLACALAVLAHAASWTTDEHLLRETGIYWHNLSLRLCEAYRDEMLAAAVTDPSIKQTCYYRRYLGIRQLGDNLLDGFRFLFTTDNPVGIGPSQWLDIPSSLLAHCLGIWEGDDQDILISQLEEIGDILGELGPPPWVSKPVGSIIDRDRLSSRESTPVPLGRTARTGAVALLAIIFEGSGASYRQIPPAGDLGPLASARPYLECRARRSNQPPQSKLDVEEHFGEMLAAWATGRVNLIHQHSA